MKSKREDIIRVGLIIQNDLSKALGYPCILYQESDMCRACKVDPDGTGGISGLTSVYDAKTLYKVVLDVISIIQTLKLKEK